MRKNIFFAILFFSFFAAALFAEVTVVNPVPGNFANEQTLLIESNDGEEIYYSFSGTDPLTSGFAYDGPVLLDVTGNVELRVAVISKDLSQSEIVVRYAVTPAEMKNLEHVEFFSAFDAAPIFEYVAGEKISIPFTLEYAFGENRIFERGKEVSISKDATVERFLPISLRDGLNEWRYVVHIMPSTFGRLSRREVPFEIVDWTTLIFTDAKKIYSLDGSWWHGANEFVSIDRSVENTLYYQSVDYSPENPVTKIVLPPKSELKVEQQFGGGIKISVSQDFPSSAPCELSASPLSPTRLVSAGLHSEILLDTFSADKIETNIPLDVYCDDVYQGTLFASVSLNRTAPNVPLIESSAKGFYSRENVEVSASAKKDLKIFAGVCKPIEIPLSFEMRNLSDLKFDEPIFAPYSGDVITLFADTEKILAYKILFYSEDSLGVKSPTSSYSVVVDKYNYYVDSSSQKKEQDGSLFAPFKDLSEFSRIANSREFSRFFIKGDATLPSGEVSIASNVELLGTDDAKIKMPENCAVVMKNAGLFARNIIFEKTLQNSPSKKMRGAATALTNMFIIENSAVTFDNCELLSNFAGDGTVLNLSSSALSLSKSVVVNNSQVYSSAVSALSSKIRISDSRFLCISDTGVAFSVNGGSFELSNTFVEVSARMSRIAELIDTLASLEDNNFSATNSLRKSEDDLIYKTSKTKFKKNAGNIFHGSK